MKMEAPKGQPDPHRWALEPECGELGGDAEEAGNRPSNRRTQHTLQPVRPPSSTGITSG